MTLLGFFFLFAILICFILPYRYFVYLLILSCVFSASSVINIDGKSIQPYLLCSAIYVVKAFLIQQQNKIRLFNKKLSLFCVFFVTCVIYTGILSPFIFENITILPKNLDSGIAYGGEKLKFGLNNIAQIIYTIINLLTVCYLHAYRNKIQNEQIRKIFIFSIIIVLVMGILDYISKSIGVFQFPTNLFLNSHNLNASDGGQYNSTIMGFMRFSSLFSEASYCGAFLPASLWALKAMEINTRKIYFLLILCTICSILTFSATAITAFFFGFSLYVINLHKRFSIIFGLIIIISICVFLFLQTIIGDVIYNIMINKLESQSGEVRSLSILYSLKAFINSYGLGVGLGSTRSTSFIFDLLASVGIIGCISFYLIYKHLFLKHKNSKDFQYIFTYSIILMFSQILAIPDFSFSCFWLGIYIAATYNVHNRKNKFKTQKENICLS